MSLRSVVDAAIVLVPIALAIAFGQSAMSYPMRLVGQILFRLAR